jgi:hypothetical protein
MLSSVQSFHRKACVLAYTSEVFDEWLGNSQRDCSGIATTPAHMSAWCGEVLTYCVNRCGTYNGWQTCKPCECIELLVSRSDVTCLCFYCADAVQKGMFSTAKGQSSLMVSQLKQLCTSLHCVTSSACT